MAEPAVDPNPPAMGLHDLPHDREPDAGSAAVVAARREALEDLEDPFVVLGRDATSPIMHRDVLAVGLFDDVHVDARLGAGPHVLDRVADQVREHLVETRAVAVHQRRMRGQPELDKPLLKPG